MEPTIEQYAVELIKAAGTLTELAKELRLTSEALVKSQARVRELEAQQNLQVSKTYGDTRINGL